MFVITRLVPVNGFVKNKPFLYPSKGIKIRRFATLTKIVRIKNALNGYFAASAKIALSLMLTQTLTQTLTLILTLIPILSLTQTEVKHYFVSRGKKATSYSINLNVILDFGVNIH